MPHPCNTQANFLGQCRIPYLQHCLILIAQPMRAALGTRLKKGRVVGGDYDDDAASNASSDLLEIESFSTGSAMQPMCPAVFRREADNGGNNFFYNGGQRRSMDEGSTAMMTECYEPSVEWSMTTT
ncbi:hypothetical protein PIB30_089048 [Stylosanthes scabra]|uniref:Uncharacterized protein n=1 Tax=Stylosanthes scabra TaxID=79078 RepID=A0ABU6ZSI1_9FABA|nr:hypothetical protein [Stylosanthes scabra]